MHDVVWRVWFVVGVGDGVELEAIVDVVTVVRIEEALPLEVVFDVVMEYVVVEVLQAKVCWRRLLL